MNKTIDDIMFIEHETESGNKFNISYDFLIDGYDEVSDLIEELNIDINLIKNQMIKIKTEYKKNNHKDIYIELLDIYAVYCAENGFDPKNKLSISLNQMINNSNLLENFLGFINNRFNNKKDSQANKELLFKYALFIKYLNEKLQLRGKVANYYEMKIKELKEEGQKKGSR